MVISAASGAMIQIPFSTVFANDSDVDGDTLAISDFSDLSADGGWVSTNSQSFTYVSPAGMIGQDRFAYLVVDGHGGQCVGSVIINLVASYQLQIDTSNLNGSGTKLTMGGEPNEQCEIQASTDLVNWVNLGSVTADQSGIIQFVDSAAKNYPNRFYRVLPQ
jgi:hypothetical protein